MARFLRGEASRFHVSGTSLGWLLPAILADVFAPFESTSTRSVVIIAAICFGGILFFLERQRRKPLEVVRGAFYDGVGSVRRKAGLGRPLAIFLIPLGSRATLEQDPELLPSIYIHRNLLNSLSKAEIDALVALQLPYNATNHLRWMIKVGVYAIPLAVAYGVPALPFNSSTKWSLILLGLMLAMAMLQMAVRYLGQQQHRFAIMTLGNPIAHVSAIAKLWWSFGAKLGTDLTRLAQTAGLSPSQIETLLREIDRPATDRYPTSGDYVDVGFE